jgi:Cu(I)/Ag(I) efflux system membrane fusion protein/cobalt-zinc-cadmium efflux system membrane fusion protein
LTVTFASRPDPPAEGENAFEVTVVGSDGSPVTDATVTTVFSMPAMPSMNMPAMRSDATLAHEGDGRYRGTGRLEMGGTWNVAVTVARGSEELGTRRFSVVANE